MFKLSIPNLILRYYAMILCCILAVVTHQWWLVVLTFAIAVSAVLGYKFNWPRVDKEEGKVIFLEGPKTHHRKAG